VAMMVVTVVVGGGLYGRTPHNCRGHSPRAMPGKNGHTAGMGHSGGHAPQNGAKWQDVQTMQRQCRPDRGEKVAPHGTPPDQKNRGDFSIETIHCQTKLMGEYARIYGDFKMADGTHKITQYDMTFVFRMVIDCLLRSKFVGYTANFTKNSDVIKAGVGLFFEQDISSTASAQVMQNKILVGSIPGYFDPFVDNEVDLAAMDSELKLAPAPSTSAEVHPNKPISDILGDCDHSAVDLDADLKQDLEAPAVPQKARNGFMTDEGSVFPLVTECFDWTHLLDRRHFATQILSAWHGLTDPKKFKSDVYKILYSPCVETMNSLLKQDLSKYHTNKAQAFLKKISDKQHQLCYSHTCCTFTAGHVSDQRMEQEMAAIKANRKLKSMLSKCNYGEAVS
jgi:hypothetical protein